MSGLNFTLQVFIAGQHVGGAAELKALQKDGKLGQLLVQSSSSALPKDLQDFIALSKARAQVGPPGFTTSPMGSDWEAGPTAGVVMNPFSACVCYQTNIDTPICQKAQRAFAAAFCQGPLSLGCKCGNLCRCQGKSMSGPVQITSVSQGVENHLSCLSRCW